MLWEVLGRPGKAPAPGNPSLSFRRHLSSHTVISPQVCLKGHKHCQLANTRKSQCSASREGAPLSCVWGTRLFRERARSLPQATAAPPLLQKQKSGWILGSSRCGPTWTQRNGRRRPTSLGQDVQCVRTVLGLAPAPSSPLNRRGGAVPTATGAAWTPAGVQKDAHPRLGPATPPHLHICHCTDENKGCICQSRCSLGRLILATFAKCIPRTTEVMGTAFLCSA